MKSSHRVASACALSLSLVLTGCAELGVPYSTGNTTPPTSSSGQGQANSANRPGNISIEHAKALAMANGLVGQPGLPPGIERRLAKGKSLPPGIAKNRVPQAMLAGLPSIEGHEWLQLGRDLVLVAIGTAVVVDILNDVFL